MIKAKLKAFLLHLGISLIIFVGVLYLIIFHWYPVPFFTSDGGWDGILIIATVDLVLGPGLTLIIYKPKKRGLKFDYTVISLIQAAALTWGSWVVYVERPIATVFAEGYFLTIKASEFEQRGIKKQSLKKFGDKTPVWIYSRLPEDFNALQQLRLTAFQLGRPVHSFSNYYVPIGEEEIENIASHSIDLDTFLTGKTVELKKYNEFLKRHASIKDELIYLTWRARFKYKIVVLKSDNLEYIGTLDIMPPGVKIIGDINKK